MKFMIGFKFLLIAMIVAGVLLIFTYTFYHHQGQLLRNMFQNDAMDGVYLPFTIRNRSIVNPHNFKYILNPTNACSGDVEVVICVPVARHKAEARRIVAETWGSYANNKTNKAVLLFFVGVGRKGEPSSVQKSIEEEFKKNQNIVQEDYLDVYRNLSLKSMSILKWIRTFCRNAQFVIKADADIYSNMSLLVQNLRDTQSIREKMVYRSGYKPDSKSFDPRHFIMGKVMSNTLPARNYNSKWVVTMKEYPYQIYPTFVSGTCYSMPVLTARYLFQVAIRTELFWLEDVFLTGIAASIGKVIRISNRYQTVEQVYPIKGCLFKMLASAHSYSLREIKKIHTDLHHPNLIC